MQGVLQCKMKVSQETQDQHGKSIQNSQQTNGMRRKKLKDPFVILSKLFHNALKRRTHVPQGNLAEWDTEVGNPTGI